MAEGGRDRTWLVHPDHGGNSSGRRDQPVDDERGPAWLETAAGVRYFPDGRKDAGKSVPGSPVVVRYADDLVALCVSAEQAQQVKDSLARWLAPRGLAFNEDKTRIVRLEDGFDFLGFSIRRYRNGKLLIKPSKAAVQRIRSRLAAEVSALHGANAEAVINKLNPVIRGGRPTTAPWSLKDLLRSGSLPVAAHLPVGAACPSEQVEALGHGPVLRHVSPRQAGPLGVRRPRQRPLPGQVLLDTDCPAPPGRRRRVARRPRPGQLLGQTGTASQTAPGPFFLRLLQSQEGRCPAVMACCCTQTGNRKALRSGNSGSKGCARRSAATRSPLPAGHRTRTHAA